MLCLEHTRTLSEYSDRSYDSGEEMKLSSKLKLEAQHQRLKSTALNMTQTAGGGGIIDLSGGADGRVITDEEANDIY